MGLFSKDKNTTTGKDGNLYFGKGTEGGRAPDMAKLNSQSKAAKDIAALIEQETEAEERLEQIRLQKQAVLDELEAEQQRLQDYIALQAHQAEISKEETAQQLRQETVKTLVPKQLNPNDNPYRVALLQVVDGEMVKVYCDRPDWRACPQHGSASPFITTYEGKRYIPDYLKPNGAKTPREKTLAAVHNNFPDWVGDYLQPLKPEARGLFGGGSGHYENWEQAEFGMFPSLIRKNVGVPTYLKISGKIREDSRFDEDVETRVKIDEEGNAVLHTFYSIPKNVQGRSRSSFDVNTVVPKDKINEAGMKAAIKEHYETIVDRSKLLNNILVTVYRDGEEVNVFEEKITYDPSNPEHKKVKPRY